MEKVPLWLTLYSHPTTGNLHFLQHLSSAPLRQLLQPHSDSSLALVGDSALRCDVVVALRSAHPGATPGVLHKKAAKYFLNSSLALVAKLLHLEAFLRPLSSPPSKHRLGTALEALIGHQQMQAPHEVAAVVARVMAAIDYLPR